MFREIVTLGKSANRPLPRICFLGQRHTAVHQSRRVGFRKLAEKKGLLKPGVKAMEVVDWLKKDHGLGHGHAMAIYATFKAKKEWK